MECSLKGRSQSRGVKKALPDSVYLAIPNMEFKLKYKCEE
jgi:hypothetical protein